MVDTLTFHSFLSKKTPFSKRHKIIFKEGSEAHQRFGQSVYGIFMRVATTRKLELLKEEAYKLKIDAPQINGHNTALSNGLKVELYFQGVHFNNIDLEATYVTGIE